MKKSDKNNFPKWDDWLRINAERHFIEKNRRNAWKGVAGAHDPRNALSEKISIFYSDLPAEQQQLFREGLVKCMLTLPQKTDYIDIFLMLIQLCSECDCYEIVQSNFFEKIVFKGNLGYLNKDTECRDDNICIFYKVIQVLRYFSEYGTGKKIKALAEKMMYSSYFPKKHVYQIFLILCKAQPNKLFEHWSIVRSTHFSFRKFLSEKQKAYSSYPVLQAELKKIIDVQDIENFNRKIKTLEDYRAEDEWLIHLLHEKNDGPVTIEKNKNVIEFRVAGSPQKPVVIVRYPSQISEGFLKVLSIKAPSIELLYEKGNITEKSIINAYMSDEYDIPNVERDNESVPKFENAALNKIYRQNRQCMCEGLMV